MYEMGNQSYFEILFSGDSIADSINKAEYVKEIVSYDRKMMEKYKETKKLIADKEQAYTKEQQDLCTLIYYPKEKLKLLKKQDVINDDWYTMTLRNLIKLAGFLSSKYTRSKVRKAMPEEYAYIIDELLHAQPDEDNNQLVYHQKIIETIIGIDSAEDFIIELTSLIKRLAVDHLHILGDIYD